MPTGDGSIDLLSEPVVLDDLGPAPARPRPLGSVALRCAAAPGRGRARGRRVLAGPAHRARERHRSGRRLRRPAALSRHAPGRGHVAGVRQDPALGTRRAGRRDRPGLRARLPVAGEPVGSRARLGPRGADRVAAGGHGYRVPVRVRPRPGARARHGHRRHRRRLARARPRHGAGVAGPGAHHLLPDVGVRLGMGRPRHDRLPHRLGPDTARAGGRGTSARWHGP